MVQIVLGLIFMISKFRSLHLAGADIRRGFKKTGAAAKPSAPELHATLVSEHQLPVSFSTSFLYSPLCEVRTAS